jgi:hypothetical protein
MRRIELTEEQREEIKSSLQGAHDESGSFNIQVDLEDYVAEVVGFVEIDGYTEDDYFNGTGAWVETYRDASVFITLIDEGGNEYIVDQESQDEIYNYLTDK